MGLGRFYSWCRGPTPAAEGPWTAVFSFLGSIGGTIFPSSRHLSMLGLSAASSPYYVSSSLLRDFKSSTPQPTTNSLVGGGVGNHHTAVAQAAGHLRPGFQGLLRLLRPAPGSGQLPNYPLVRGPALAPPPLSGLRSKTRTAPVAGPALPARQSLTSRLAPPTTASRCQLALAPAPAPVHPILSPAAWVDVVCRRTHRPRGNPSEAVRMARLPHAPLPVASVLKPGALCGRLGLRYVHAAVAAMQVRSPPLHGKSSGCMVDAQASNVSPEPNQRRA